MSPKVFLIIIIAFVSNFAVCEDVIYLKDGTQKACKVSAIADSIVRFKNLQNLSGPDYVMDQSNIHFVFLETGQYITFLQKNPAILENFDLEYDQIFTKDNNLIAAKIVETNQDQIKFKISQDLEGPAYTKKFNNIHLVIRSSGAHQIYSSPEECVSVMKKYENDINYTYGNESEEKQSLKVVEVEDTMETESAKKEVDPDEIIANAHNKYTAKEKNKEDRIEDFSYEIYEERALQKTKELGVYISIIADKSTESEYVDNAIDLAVQLFLNEESSVEVSNVNSNSKVQYPIRTYLTRLKLLPYDHIEISWSNISYVSNLKKGADGRYYGIITMQQKFFGFLEGEVVYKDTTQKNIEVVVDLYDKVIDGETQKLWEVFLSEIGVVQTRA